MLYVFNYRKATGGIWLPAFLAKFITRYAGKLGLTLDHDAIKPDPIRPIDL